MSAEPRFLDTNVLVCLFDADAPAKQATARALLTQGPLILSTQVLSELYVTVTRKLGKPLDPAHASRAVADLCAFPVRDVTASLVLAAIRRSRESQLSYWDALVVETAIDAGARVLLTEDLQTGQVIGGLRVENPFPGGKPTTP
jgi:predicted nucleic acid-binding protein